MGRDEGREAREAFQSVRDDTGTIDRVQNGVEGAEVLFLGQIICSRNSCRSRKYLVISALVIGSREIIPEHFEHVTHAQAC